MRRVARQGKAGAKGYRSRVPAIPQALRYPGHCVAHFPELNMSPLYWHTLYHEEESAGKHSYEVQMGRVKESKDAKCELALHRYVYVRVPHAVFRLLVRHYVLCSSTGVP